MSGSVTIYYGMSGTFKATTIKKLLDTPGYFPVWSFIKPWKRNERDLFSGFVEKNDLNFANLHLCMLESSAAMFPESNLLVERGVTDMLFYYTRQHEFIELEKVVNKEKEILKNYSNVKKVLMIQEDSDFISNVILKEKTRADKFSGLDEYFSNQEEYVKFTKELNEISEVVEIKNARDYLSSIGVMFLN